MLIPKSTRFSIISKDEFERLIREGKINKIDQDGKEQTDLPHDVIDGIPGEFRFWDGNKDANS